MHLEQSFGFSTQKKHRHKKPTDMRENNWSLISRETSVCDIICPFAFQPQGVFSGVLLSARWDKQAKVPAQLWQAALTKNFPIFFFFYFSPCSSGIRAVPEGLAVGQLAGLRGARAVVVTI